MKNRAKNPRGDCRWSIFFARWLNVIFAATVTATVNAGEPVAELKKIVIGSEEKNACSIKIVDPFNGRLTETRYVTDHFYATKGHRGELYLQLECVQSNDAARTKAFLSAIYDEGQQRWIRDFDNLLPVEKLATRDFPIRALNSEGFAVTYDAINGDPKTRSRAFAFCLRHPPVMLCGSTPDIARPYYKQSDLLPFALTLIESIEFLDHPPPEASGGWGLSPNDANSSVNGLSLQR